MLFMGSTFNMLLSQRILTDVLREKTSQRTEVEKNWLHSQGKSLRNLILLSNLHFMRY